MSDPSDFFRLSSGFGFLDNVKLGSAQPDRSSSVHQVSHVELCQCPTGYVGQFCESCAPGYHRDPADGGPYARCVPCNCNGHSDTCDVNSGKFLLLSNNNNIYYNPPLIYLSVGVRKLQVAILGQSSRDISQTVLIYCHSFLSHLTHEFASQFDLVIIMSSFQPKLYMYTTAFSI